MYSVTTFPNAPTVEELAAFLEREMLLQAQEISRLAGGELLEERHVAPAKPRTGLIVLADGTDWDPGAGAGVYCYYGSAWNKLG